MSKISVIMAAYNSEQCIGHAIDSVLSQTLPSSGYEIIVVNDGSTDGTLATLSKYGDKVTVITQPKLGLPAACNRGIAEARGEFVIRLDSDDYFDSSLLSKTLGILEVNPEQHYVYTDRYEVDTQSKAKTLVRVGKDNIFDMTGCGILFRRQVFNVVGAYRDLLFEEYDLLLRLAEKGLKGWYLPEPLYYYVRRNSSITNQSGYWQKGWDELLHIWGEEKLRKYVDIQASLKGNSRFQTLQELSWD